MSGNSKREIAEQQRMQQKIANNTLKHNKQQRREWRESMIDLDALKAQDVDSVLAIIGEEDDRDQ